MCSDFSHIRFRLPGQGRPLSDHGVRGQVHGAREGDAEAAARPDRQGRPPQRGQRQGAPEGRHRLHGHLQRIGEEGLKFQLKNGKD